MPPQGNMVHEAKAQNAIGFVSLENINEKWTIVFRPNPHRKHGEAFMERFRKLGETCAGITSSHIMRPESFVEDSEGGYYAVGHGRYITLGQLLMEKPAIVADKAWTQNFIDDLFDALEQLHKKGLTAVELSPMSVLVSKSNQHRLMLMPPAGDFLDIRHDIWTRETDYLAPELFSDDENCTPEKRVDIYGAAQLVNRLFKFSALPSSYTSFVNAGLSSDPSRRPADIEAIRASIRHKKFVSKMMKIAAGVVLVCGIIALLTINFKEETPKAPFPEEAFTQSEDVPNQDSNTGIEDEYASMLEEEYESLSRPDVAEGDSAFKISPERKAEERKRLEQATSLFKQRYTKEAKAILTPVYSAEILHGDQARFMQESQAATLKLQNLMEQLANQYQIDVTTAQAEAALIIGKVTDELKRQAAGE